jgi:UDP-N-acetylmuramyl pentapeptide synthase
MRQKCVDANGITSIEDCYNASPDSMNAALKTLASIKANKKIAVLSDMLELGDYSDKLIIPSANRRLKIELIISSASAMPLSK